MLAYYSPDNPYYTTQRYKDECYRFIIDYSEYNFYQPVIFVPDLIEISGKWNESTKRLSKEILNDVAGKSILDIGCNIGFFLHEAEKKGAINCCGIDNDISVIKMGLKICNILKTKTHYILMDLNTTSLLTVKYDIILLLNILPFIKYPKELIDYCVSLCNEKLILEYDDNMVELISQYNIAKTLDSSRSSDRKISFLLP